MKAVWKTLAAAAAFGLSASALAIPALQLGEGGTSGSWTYDTTSETWVCTGSCDGLTAYANATTANGGNGDYAWATTSETKTAYLVIAAVPSGTGSGPTDVFDVTVTGATLLYSGYGNPPVEDSNDLPGHGVYATYYEIYSFVFDGPIVDISDQQPCSPTPCTPGTGKGYTESIGVVLNSLSGAATGVHFDLYTVDSTITGATAANPDNKYVKTNAPFSHDAEYGTGGPGGPGGDDVPMPEPGSLALLGAGLLGLGLMRRRKSA